MSILIIGSLLWRQMKNIRWRHAITALCGNEAPRVHPAVVLLYNLTTVKSELKWVTHGN